MCVHCKWVVEGKFDRAGSSSEGLAGKKQLFSSNLNKDSTKNIFNLLFFKTVFIIFLGGGKFMNNKQHTGGDFE